MQSKLQVHGFVLAGGKSSRKGKDKALLKFCGKPMIEIAMEKLRLFCEDVAVAGNRDDLTAYAAVVREARLGVGPAAGIEAGLLAASLPWVLFVPVDVPLMPPEVLCAWVKAVISAEENAGVCASYLMFEGQPQPAFCVMRKECVASWSNSLNSGERRLLALLRDLRVHGSGSVRAMDVEGFNYAARNAPLAMSLWFSNVNTPEELVEAEACARE